MTTRRAEGRRSAGPAHPNAVPRAARPAVDPRARLLQLQRLAGNKAVSGLLGPAVQRNATTQSISPSYAGALTDEDLRSEITAVENLLREPETRSDEESLSANLQLLRAEFGKRHPDGTPSAAPAPGGIPPGGAPVGKVGIVNYDRSPELRLRSAPDTTTGEVLRTLPFNTHVQVIKQFPGGWYFVSTPDGDLGYVASSYIWTRLPEPNATLHRVESGVGGTAIGIAEKYYGAYSDDWGQDLRFYVNVLAWANKVPVPDETDGWKQVHFNADRLIWVPSQPFAKSLSGVLNSGSLSYNIADALGMAKLIERVAQLWDDVISAISKSGKYIGEAIRRHAEEAITKILYSLAVMMIAAIAILAISTAIGAAIGGLTTAGVGAGPGAAAGFEVGMVLLNWLGVASLVVWIGQALVSAGSAFAKFLGAVWNARGDDKKLDIAAKQFAETIGVLFGILLEALVLYATSKGSR